MKVILLENVENLGLPGEITSVKAGYYRNFLQPRGLAREATDANLRMLQAKRKKLEDMASKIVKASESLGQQLKGVKLVFTLKAASNNRLFGSVTTADIAARLAELGFDIEKRRISATTHIKTIGNHTVRVRLEGGVVAPITVSVEREGGAEEVAEAPVEEVAEGEEKPVEQEESSAE